MNPAPATRNSNPSGPAPRSVALLDCLVSHGVSHIVGLPDNASAALFRAAEERSGLTVLTVTREGEAFAIAAGIWVGGQKSVVVIQNTGLLESGDSLRGTAVRMGVPLLCFVTYRGYARMHGAGVTPPTDGPTRSDLVRRDLDSVALITEPTLRAWGIPHCLFSADQDIGRVNDAWDRALREARPVAVLLTRTLA